MTITELITAARNRYNAYGSSFWGDDELRSLIYEACMVLAVENGCIERSFEATTVIGTQEYTLPNYTIGIKRAVWRGIALEPITFEDDDLLTGFDETTQDSGDPAYFIHWENKIRLRPIPSSAATLKVYTYNEPQPLVAASNLEVPTRYHIYILDYVTALMVAKDNNFDVAKMFLDRWDKQVVLTKTAGRKLKRAQGFQGVKSIDNIHNTRWG